jgi:hypothetical protein
MGWSESEKQRKRLRGATPKSERKALFKKAVIQQMNKPTCPHNSDNIHQTPQKQLTFTEKILEISCYGQHTTPYLTHTDRTTLQNNMTTNRQTEDFYIQGTETLFRPPLARISAGMTGNHGWGEQPLGNHSTPTSSLLSILPLHDEKLDVRTVDLQEPEMAQHYNEHNTCETTTNTQTCE